MNEELLASAVSFLKDPNVNSSPFAKKVEFLESKGLNQQEIEEAIRRANGGEVTTTSSNTERRDVSSSGGSGSSSSSSYQQQQQQPAPLDYYNFAPQVPERSWKDYFIMATATAGVSYGLYQVVTRYLVPSILPPSQSSIEKDKAKIDEEFIKIDKLLEQLTQDQTDIKTSNEAKSKEIDTVINNVNDFLSKYNKDKLTFDDDLRLMKLEIDNLRNSVEKNMGSTKENIKDELQEIGEEIVSLKQLITARSESRNGTGEAARKLAPVSSIPSASEILKKAKAASSKTSKTPEQASSPTLTNSNSTPNSNTISAVNNDGLKQSPVSKSDSNTVKAAGIPEWQLKHKENEEAREKEKNAEPSSSIPSWQQAAVSSTQTEQPQEGTTPAIPTWQQLASTQVSGNDDEVAAAIANVGVPSWQLNAST